MEHDKHRWTVGDVEMEEITFKGPYVSIKAEGALLFFDGQIAIVGGSSPEKALANARLIAAAPDSMKACEALVSFCESKERLNGDSVCPTEAYDLAKAAINKATGE